MLLLTNDLTTPANALFTRYDERMLVENELSPGGEAAPHPSGSHRADLNSTF